MELYLHIELDWLLKYPKAIIWTCGQDLVSIKLVYSPGTIDSGYRGEILVKFRDLSDGVGQLYEAGDRIAQLIILPYPKVTFKEVEELSETERNTGGWGSTNEQDSTKNS